MNKEILNLIQQKKEQKKQQEMEKIAEIFSIELSKINKINFSNENISISNFSELLEAVLPNIPSSFSVDNLEELAKYIKIPKEFPKSFSIDNIQELAKCIKVPSQKEFPKEFKISNFPETKFNIEIPDNVKKLSFKHTEMFLSNIYERIGAFGKGLKDGIFITNKNPNEAIPVRMVDKEGKEFTQFKHIVTGVPPFLGISNAVGERISPATEETLQAILLAKSGSVYSDEWLLAYGIDESDATYYYIGFKLVGAENWRIQRITKVDNSVKWASGDADGDIAWTNRTSQIYGNL